MTIKDLREAIKGLPGDYEVVLGDDTGEVCNGGMANVGYYDDHQFDMMDEAPEGVRPNAFVIWPN
ncbi:hypothetical protein [Hymenobacter siberiensis]|uniref:hypothetical protein n=1 Tax=Hymenobacter siberiensis TaxID=2848396 RepID=UPI001C1DE4D5|nr:hypothetical protein [Hymenobacter siberiensis]